MVPLREGYCADWHPAVSILVAEGQGSDNRLLGVVMGVDHVEAFRDPDNGAEAKVQLSLTQAWTPYSFPLTAFTTADLTRIYLLFELVFSGPSSRSVYFRNVRYTAQ